MRLCTLLFVLLLKVSNIYSQNISGIINSYTKVIEIDSSCLPSVTVISSNEFALDDTVLIIQMKGASIDLSNNSNFGSIINYNNAGNYEFNYISSIVGNQIFFKNRLSKSYSVSDFVQLIKVPFYSGNVNVSATLTASPWNGNTGGVLVFEASGTITLNSNIDVSGMGFRGGQPSASIYFPACGAPGYYYPIPSNLGAEKGESIALVNSVNGAGRGAPANGGGGGNSHNSGGGGGGNAGQGGIGGKDLNTCAGIGGIGIDVGGVGGRQLSYSNTLNKIFFGGGGGGGHQNDLYLSSTPGTNGGGIIIIKATSIDGNGNSIIADGLDQIANSGADGAGGGGAGGTILLDVQSYSSTTNISAKGGRGGNPTCTSCSNPIVECLGPGGGGGGGVIWHSNNTIPVNINTSVNGGASGLYMHPSSTCFNTPNGAAPGSSGIELIDLELRNVSPNPSFSINTTKLDIICNNDGIIISSPLGGTSPYSYSWSNGFTTDSNIVSQNGTYYVTVTDANGCIAIDSANVESYSEYIITNNVNICQGDSFFVMGSYQKESGIYVDNVVSPIDCDTIYTTVLVVNNSTNDSVTTSICFGDSILIIGINRTKSGIYIDSSLSAFGCDSITVFTLNVSDEINYSISDADTIKQGENIQLNVTGGIAYNWTPSESLSCSDCPNPIANPSISTIYYVTLTDDFGCSIKDSVITTVVVENCDENNIKVPTAFTPNGDNLNDRFPVFGVGGITLELLEIFNRWGEKLFETENLTIGWDGTYKGVVCDLGVYIYLVRGNCQGRTVLKKGNLTLIR